MRKWRAMVVAGGKLGVARAQTLVDLRTQSKSVDFSGANTTKPFKSGTVLPATCTVGDGRTIPAAAAPICTGAGIAGLNIALNGTTQGTQATLNFISGTGIVQSCTNNSGASRVDCTPSFNTALIPTHDTIHANENYCGSSNGTTSYTCALPSKALPVYTLGQTFLLNVDATCASSCSLNVDGLGAKSIKKKDGVTDPAGTLIAGQAQFVWFDGTIIRLMYF
jgi:hypothetical protein